MKGICKLCGQEKDLIKKSHIIPEFMYQYLFDADHKFFQTDSFDLLNEKSKPGYKLTGEYEGGLLCEKCDNETIGKYETYAAKAMFGNNISVTLAPKITDYYNGKGERWSKCENMIYKDYKLFLLTILWRAHISSRPLFSEIDLGPHADKIRKMILTDNPGNEGDYPILHWTTVKNKEISNDYILQPRMIRSESHYIHIFPISGMIMMFYISNHKKPQDVLNNTIKTDGTMTIGHIPTGQAGKFIAQYLSSGKR